MAGFNGSLGVDALLLMDGVELVDMISDWFSSIIRISIASQLVSCPCIHSCTRDSIATGRSLMFSVESALVCMLSMSEMSCDTESLIVVFSQSSCTDGGVSDAGAGCAFTLRFCEGGELIAGCDVLTGLCAGGEILGTSAGGALSFGWLCVWLYFGSSRCASSRYIGSSASEVRPSAMFCSCPRTRYCAHICEYSVRDRLSLELVRRGISLTSWTDLAKSLKDPKSW